MEFTGITVTEELRNSVSLHSTNSANLRSTPQNSQSKMTRMTGKKLSLMSKKSLRKKSLQRPTQTMKKMRERKKKSLVKMMEQQHNPTMVPLFLLRETKTILPQ